MMYLKKFSFLTEDDEINFFQEEKRTCFDSFYPFQVLTGCRLENLEFEPVTILYGGNGSGKTTALNIMAETLQLERDSLYNRSSFFETYTSACGYELADEIPAGSRVITSDDVFDYMLNVRTINQGIDEKRDDLFEDYTNKKYSDFRLESLADYEQLKKVNQARSSSKSKYVRKNLMDNIREKSNGESAFMYFVDKINEKGLYLLDEPENSLSPARQLELMSYIEDSARFFGCQFIIATHSPFLLSMKGAKIYDLDDSPVKVKNWTELENVRIYYNFFKDYEGEF